MEENNTFETNKDSSGSGGMLYGTEPQPQEEIGRSAVYGTELQSQESSAAQPVQLTKPSEPESTGATTPVQLTKPSEPQPAPVQPGFYGQPVNGGQMNYNGQQMNGGQMNYNGQQMNGGQMNYNGQPANGNPMGFGPMQVPPPIQGAQPMKPKKSRTGLAVGIVCAAAVVIVAAAGVFIFKSFLGGGDPGVQLAKGMANMAEEMAAYQSSIARDIGFTELSELKNTKPMHTVIDVSFTDPSAVTGIDNFDIELDGVTDWKNRMAEYDLSVGAYGFSMNIGNMVAADNTLYVSVPIIFQEDVYSLDLTNLGRDFNHSAWSVLMEETLPEDYSLTLFGDAQDSAENAEGDTELHGIIAERSRALAASMEFETVSQKREFMIDGAAAEYGGVRVTIDRDAYNEALENIKNDFLASDFYAEFMKGYQTSYSGDFYEFKEEFEEFVEEIFGIRFEQDVVIDFYLDKKGRIVNISTPADLMVSSLYSDVESFAVDINFSGIERTLDSIGGGIYMQSGDEILYLEISREASITKEFYTENLTLCLQNNNSDDEITFWYANKWGYDDHTFDLQILVDVPGDSLGLRADGAYTDIVKGERYTFRLNHGAFSIDGEDLLLMTGSVKLEPSDNDIEVPRNATNILEMSEEEIMYLLYYSALF